MAISSNDAENIQMMHLDKNVDRGPCITISISLSIRWAAGCCQSIRRFACTPDIYLFDAQNKLYYRGRLDDSRPKMTSPPDWKWPSNGYRRPLAKANRAWTPSIHQVGATLSGKLSKFKRISLEGFQWNHNIIFGESGGSNNHSTNLSTWKTVSFNSTEKLVPWGQHRFFPLCQIWVYPTDWSRTVDLF